MSEQSTITIETVLAEQHYDHPKVTKLEGGKQVPLTIDDLCVLEKQMRWLLSYSIEQRGKSRIEPGVLYYHKRNHNYYLSKLIDGVILFDATCKDGVISSTRPHDLNITLDYMDANILRKVAKQPKFLKTEA